MEKRSPLELAQLIVRGNNINKIYDGPYGDVSSIYRFTNEDIAGYFKHLENKRNVLTVIGSGSQILNGILAGTRNFDCFDISIFPEYYLHLQLASVLALSKEEYLKYYFSSDREEVFNDDFYEKISDKLTGKYKEFWDTLYMFDDGYDIWESLLFRQDVYFKNQVIENNLYLQEDNYDKLKRVLEMEKININPTVCNIITTKFSGEYDLVNLSNILTYYFKRCEEYVEFFKNNFNLTADGEIINYMFGLRNDIEEQMKRVLKPNGYVENIGDRRLLVYKK